MDKQKSNVNMFKVGDLVLVKNLKWHNPFTEGPSISITEKGYITVVALEFKGCGVSLIKSGINVIVPFEQLEKIEY